MTRKMEGENAYFAASNSTRGFVSYYNEVFRASRIGHVYAIKGGPGTGKSRFLRDVSDYAAGEGWAVEYIYCSSDPDSLDAVILTKEGRVGIALLDATAPHLFEMTCPGAYEDIIDLGRFWSSEKLSSQRAGIEQLNQEKSAAYRRAYRYLSGFGDMRANRDELAAPYIRKEKLAILAKRLLADLPEGEGYLAQPALIHSVGMRGRVGFDTYFHQSKKLYLVLDCHGAAQYFMQELGNLILQKKLAVRISHDPIEADKIDGLFLLQSGIAFAVCPEAECDYPSTRVVMRRFVNTAAMRSVRRELHCCDRIGRALLGEALEALEKVREVHFRLEQVYSAAMDFEAKEAFTKAFCQTLFKNQSGAAFP